MSLPRELYQWPAYWQELFLERAAIMEFEGNLSRLEAEREAEKDIRWIAKGEKTRCAPTK